MSINLTKKFIYSIILTSRSIEGGILVNEDKIYMVRKIFVMLTCILVFVTLGLGVIKFQTKDVIIDYYGNVEYVKTMSNTVEGLLMQNKIYIDEKAIVTPGVESRLEDNMLIRIYSDESEVAYLDLNEYYEMANTNIVEKVVEEIQYIDYAKQEKSNASMTRGTTKVVQQGQKGEKTATYVIKYQNETEVARKLVSEEISKAAVAEIIDVGTAIPTVSRSSTFRVNSEDLVAKAGFKQYNIKLSREQQIYAYNMATKYGIQYELFLALMYVESGFNPNTISKTNDYGLCQINKGNHPYITRQLGVTNFLDPYQNMQAGAFFLARYFKSWGKTVKDTKTLELHSLNSYNRGDASYQKYLAKGNTATSWYYGNKVVAARDRLLANGHF